ncbi:hypothetical protein L3Q82_004315 [Scortum barcoo]|uniref:Uncharacterized protein n=1 Tax=Scortum barcoo TaxID=214431 RepID=A0ACB8VJG2_9TELE|nr:hypothetical protein L3Q82_004315 [Scortum barcoo]
MAAELGSYKQAHTSSPPLTLGNSRVVEGPAPLKELGSRAQAMRIGSSEAPRHDCYPNHIAPPLMDLPAGGPVCHGRPYQGRNAPDNIAPRIIRAHKPLHHSKVAVQGGGKQTKAAAEDREAEIQPQLQKVKPGDWVYVKVFKRKWDQPRREGPFKVTLTTPTALKVQVGKTWLTLGETGGRSLSICLKQEESQPGPSSRPQGVGLLMPARDPFMPGLNRLTPPPPYRPPPPQWNPFPSCQQPSEPSTSWQPGPVVEQPPPIPKNSREDVLSHCLHPRPYFSDSGFEPSQGVPIPPNLSLPLPAPQGVGSVPGILPARWSPPVPASLSSLLRLQCLLLSSLLPTAPAGASPYV